MLCLKALTFLCFCYCLSLSSGIPTGELCTVKDDAPGCVCEAPDGVIDLRGLASTDGIPRFSGMQDPNGFEYEFNPCNIFTSHEDCTNVYICQKSSFDGKRYAIASTGSEGIYIDGAKTYIYYDGPGGRESQVELACDPDREEPYVSTIGDSQSYLVYQFTLTAREVCPGLGGIKKSAGTAAGIAGLVLMLLLIAGVATYFIVGAVILKVRYQKNGTDLIVNKIFWFALPGLIKEGFIFTFGPCFLAIKGQIMKRRGYSSEKL